MSYSYPQNVTKFASYVTLVHLKNEGVSTAQLQNISDNVYNTSVGTLIALPMPNEISDSQGMRWVDEADQSLVGLGMEKAKMYAGKIFSETAKNTGKNIEKHSALIFDGVEVKTYSFTWKLIPMNEAEANGIMNIINELRTYSLPSLIGDSGFNFPDVFKVKFKGKSAFSGFKLLPSVLTQINATYGDGNSFMVYNGGHASEVTLSLTFSEITSRNQDIQRRYT